MGATQVCSRWLGQTGGDLRQKCNKKGCNRPPCADNTFGARVCVP